MNNLKLSTSPVMYDTEMSARFYDLHGREHYVEGLPRYRLREYVMQLLNATKCPVAVIFLANPQHRMHSFIVSLDRNDPKTLGHIWLTDRPEPVLFKD